MAMKNNANRYNAADIEAYWQGRLDARTMHAMERAALDDPFLADAMEGYKLQWDTEQKSATPHLQELQAQLQQRITAPEKKNRIAWWKPAMAASILVIGGTVAWLRWQSTREQGISSSEVAAAQTDTAKTIDVPGVMDSLQALNPDMALQEKKEAPTPSTNTTTPTPRSTPIPAPSGAEEPAPSITKSAAPGASNTAASVANDKIAPSDVATRDQLPVESEKLARKKEFAADAESKSINESRSVSNARIASVSGVVRGEDAAPVSGAILQLSGKVPGMKITAVSNDKGEYTIRYPQQTDSALLKVDVVGYATCVKSLAKLDTNAIINFNLTPAQNALSEVVVVGNGISKKKSTETATPVGGWGRFQQYLADSARVPESLNSLHGDVQVEFDVSTQGKISGFEIENSLHPTLDKEAIRLLKEGPAWENKKRKKTRVRTSIRF